MVFVVLGVLVAATIGLLLLRPNRMAVCACVLAILATVAFGMLSQSVAWNLQTAEQLDVLPPPRVGAGYATSNSCQSCHPSEFESWHQTYHRTMTQPATPETVVASFDDVNLQTDDQTARLERRGDEFWVETADPAWEREMFARWARRRNTDAPDPFATFEGPPPRIEAKVVMTTGSHHFQAYWIRSREGRQLWQFPWRYHIEQERWVHRKDVFLAPPQWRPGMWFRVWNTQCSICHSSGPKPGQDSETGSIEKTEVAELGIACESCHGPAKHHVKLNQNPLRRYQQHLVSEVNSSIVNPAKLSHERSSEVCGQCHAHFTHASTMLEYGPQFRPGDQLSMHGRLMTPTAKLEILSRFWADGANRSGGREFSGMSQSACYQRGEISCLSCHSMHQSDPNDQLTAQMDSNEACLQCHQEMRGNVKEHTHHDSKSSGSLCYNCHMPHTNYALFKGIRSHLIDSPRVKSIRPNSRANACNLCHLDKTLAWTADYLHKWYGIDKPELSEQEEKTAASLLWALQGDAGQRVIATWHFGWQPARDASGTFWLVPTLANLLNDPYAAVRWVAYDALRSDEAFAGFEYEFDGPQTVREEAVDQVLGIWKKLTPPQHETQRFGKQVLLELTGELREESLRRLLLHRNERPVSGVE